MTQSSVSDADREDDLEAVIEDADTAIEDASEQIDEVAEIEPAEDPSDDHGGHGGGFAAAALKLLMIVLVVFGLAIWLLPMLAPHAPASVAKYIMPGQQMLDDRLAVMEEKLDARAGATGDDVSAMRAEIAALTERLAAAEAEAATARADAESAKAAAAASAEAATAASTADTVVSDAQTAASEAATAADTATTAATEAGKVAAAASRDTASLSRQMTTFEARMTQLSDELAALGTSLAESPGSGEGGASPELAAAFSALQTRVEALGERMNAPTNFITLEDADRFATQDDLRSARTALAADMRGQIERLPEPVEIVTTKDLDSFRTAVDGKITDLTTRVESAEKGAADAAQSAAAAADASTSAVGEVQVAIQDASLRSAVAALNSQMSNGASFKGALDEIEALTGEAAPDELLAASGGVSTTAGLLRTFGRNAQNAISADIRAGAEDEGVLGQAGAQLRSVFAGRSTSELEGDTTQAILSQVEARLRDGKLAEALAVAESLNETSKAGLGDWLGLLTTRVTADAAATNYIATLTGSEG
ncbi:MAG: hypothetical protein AAF557_21925 [Pseudomonadota bacterium]